MRDDIWIQHEGEDYNIFVLLGADPLDVDDDNVDVEVRFKSGLWYGATFFTIRNIQSLFDKNKRTGECGGGLYFNCGDMIIVEELTQKAIIDTIRDLIARKELEKAFLPLKEQEAS